MAPVFRESGHYPVRPEHLQVKRDGRDGVRASVYEIEYQGVEVRMMLHNQADNEILGGPLPRRRDLSGGR